MKYYGASSHSESEDLSIHLYQLSSTKGRVKHLLLSTHGNKLITTWWTSKDGIDGSKQTTEDIIEGMNEGRSNETTSIQQCRLEFDRKVKKKTDDGYVEFGNELAEVKNTTVDVSQKLPLSWSGCKPDNTTPEDYLTGKYISEQKHNGVCLILHNTGTKKYIYTRTVLDITDIATVVPDLKTKLDNMPEGTVVLGELVAVNSAGKEELGPLKALTTEKTTREKATTRYNEHIKNGYTFSYKPYSVYFHLYKDVTQLPFIDNNVILSSFMPGRVLWEGLTPDMLRNAKTAGWEGFILRQPDSTIQFTLNGKPKRTGGWKCKFKDSVDCFVHEIKLGSGDHKHRYSHFHLGQWTKDGILDCGWAGPGKLTDVELDNLTTYFNSQGYKKPEEELALTNYIVVEIEYASRQKPNDEGQVCFEFPVISKIHEDKLAKECLFA